MPVVVKYDGPTQNVLRFYLANFPFFLTMVNAPALVFAMSFTVAFFSRSKELVVIMTSGRSFFRIITPIIIFSILNAFFFFWFNERVAYPGVNEAFTLQAELKGKGQEDRLRGLREIHFRAENRFYYIGNYDQINKNFYYLHLSIYNKNGSIQKIIESETGKITGKQWQLNEGTIQFFDNNGSFKKSEFFKEKTMALPEDETWFGGNREYLRNEEMNIDQVTDRINFLKRSGVDYTEYLVEYYWHIGFPAIGIIVTLLGGIIGSRMRNAQIASSIGLSITLTIVYFFIMFMGKSFGNSGILHPAIAGNLASIIFSVVIIYMMIRYHQ